MSRRICGLLREAIHFQRATQPLAGMLEALKDGFDTYGVDDELLHHLRDVEVGRRLSHPLRDLQTTELDLSAAASTQDGSPSSATATWSARRTATRHCSFVG